jgi:hypothetical protein
MTGFFVAIFFLINMQLFFQTILSTVIQRLFLQLGSVTQD